MDFSVIFGDGFLLFVASICFVVGLISILIAIGVNPRIIIDTSKVDRFNAAMLGFTLLVGGAFVYHLAAQQQSSQGSQATKKTEGGTPPQTETAEDTGGKKERQRLDEEWRKLMEEKDLLTKEQLNSRMEALQNQIKQLGAINQPPRTDVTIDQQPIGNIQAPPLTGSDEQSAQLAPIEVEVTSDVQPKGNVQAIDTSVELINEPLLPDLNNTVQHQNNSQVGASIPAVNPSTECNLSPAPLRRG